MRKLSAAFGDELADVLMSRYKKLSVIIAPNRSVDDWSKVFGDVVQTAPLPDCILRRSHLLKFEGKN